MRLLASDVIIRYDRDVITGTPEGPTPAGGGEIGLLAKSFYS